MDILTITVVVAIQRKCLQSDKLLSGFLGAVIALILSEAWRPGLVAWERKKKRNIFIAYIKNVIKPGLKLILETPKH
jgi:hypothetical protein